MKRLIVNEDMCIGCGACVSIDPKDFEFNDDGLSKPKENIIEEENESLIDAIETCPTSAIEIEESQD